MFCLLAIVVFSCTKEDAGVEDQLTGKWMLQDKTVDDAQIELTDCEKMNTIEFRENNFCLLYDACNDVTTNSGWNYKYGMLNISEHLPAAYYIEQIDVNTLKMKRNDINSEGNLQVTVLTWLKETD